MIVFHDQLQHRLAEIERWDTPRLDAVLVEPRVQKHARIEDLLGNRNHTCMGNLTGR